MIFESKEKKRNGMSVEKWHLWSERSRKKWSDAIATKVYRYSNFPNIATTYYVCNVMSCRVEYWKLLLLLLLRWLEGSHLHPLSRVDKLIYYYCIKESESTRHFFRCKFFFFPIPTSRLTNWLTDWWNEWMKAWKHIVPFSWDQNLTITVWIASNEL